MFEPPPSFLPLTATAALLATLFMAACALSTTPDRAAGGGPEAGPRVLVYSFTGGYRHASIPDGIAALRELGADHGFGVEATEDRTAFRPDALARYAAVVFLNTSGDVMDEEGREALEGFIRGGGGFVGVHAATDTEYDWPWYGGLVGAYFADHPAEQTATVEVADRDHPSTRHLPERWERYDEWYNFREAPRAVHVLVRLDEGTYEGGTMGDHPIAWCHAYGGGRSWVTALGHTPESYADPLFREHLLGGVLWAADLAEGDC